MCVYTHIYFIQIISSIIEYKLRIKLAIGSYKSGNFRANKCPAQFLSSFGRFIILLTYEIRWPFTISGKIDDCRAKFYFPSCIINNRAIYQAV